MASPAIVCSVPTIPFEVQTFADERGVSRYLLSIIALARQAFPASALDVCVGQDAEDETHRYIAIDVEASGMTGEELLAGQRAWSAGMSRICPSHLAVWFVLGWR
jgi:hypothetical protein